MAGNLFPQPSSLVEIQGSGKLMFSESAASGSRIAVVDAGQLFPAIQFLMGYVFVDIEGNQIRLGADRWPGLTPLRCMSVDVEPHGTMGPADPADGDFQKGPFYAKAKLSIKYETLKYDEESDENNPEDITFCTQELDYSCDILTVPMKVRTPIEVTINRHIRLPLVNYTLTLPKVKTPPWSLFQSLSGMVNDSSLMGGEAGTVLFDGPKVSRTVTLLGDKAWQVVLKLVYNRHGWNKTLNPKTLTWEDAADTEFGSTPPYESGPLDLLFT